MYRLKEFFLFICVLEVYSESESLISRYKKDIEYRCGMQHADDFPSDTDQKLIIEFPWIARLRYKTEPDDYEESLCSGSLISPRHVLTAAQCLFEDSTVLTSVRLGEYHTKNKTDCVFYRSIDAGECSTSQDFPVKDYIRHPGFDCTIDGTNNIGLVRLKKDVTKYTDYIRPICLPGPETPKPEIGELLSISGWGWNIQLTTYEVLTSKQKTTITLNSNEVCQNAGREMYKNQRCGVYKQDSLCLYDNGGPVMFFSKKDRRWYQEGIALSDEKNCIGDKLPLVYIQVVEYVDWIKQNMHY
ncbi:hypothetical protein ILUMI_17326 [Ignelater luminosus]|uniref:Peptidase S1 domain-containing protein n=1 Tax=Ignelater luminosus TaxID=2038154 RepID=A0A8K0CR77_IGNLU|nr:hypothetical protein ILUMI_17326 [Ignelater luminosus]